jgi:hypothetical protein
MPRLALFVSVGLLGLTLASQRSATVPATKAQLSQSRIGEKARSPRALPRKIIRLPDARSVGLPEGARVNAAMFSGISLSSEQAQSIAKLADTFAVERKRLLGGHPAGKAWSADMKARHAPFLEKQRLAYRGVLTPEQALRFDANSTRILGEWKRRGAYPGASISANGARK